MLWHAKMLHITIQFQGFFLIFTSPKFGGG
jgi:hypothetical protein